MRWDVQFGCSFEVLDHVPRELSHNYSQAFQTDATRGRGGSYTGREDAELTQQAGRRASAPGGCCCGLQGGFACAQDLQGESPVLGIKAATSTLVWGLWAFPFPSGSPRVSEKPVSSSTRVSAHRYRWWTCLCCWHQRGADALVADSCHDIYDSVFTRRSLICFNWLAELSAISASTGKYPKPYSLGGSRSVFLSHRKIRLSNCAEHKRETCKCCKQRKTVTLGVC